MTYAIGSSALFIAMIAMKAEASTTPNTTEPTIKMTMSFMGSSSQQERAKAQDRGNPKANKSPLGFATRKP